MANTKQSVLSLTPLNFKEGKLKLNAEKKLESAGEYVDKYDPAIFCRTCANVDPCLVPIFKEEGVDYSLNKKIEKYLPINVSQEDDLPLHLCYHCASTLIAWDTLIIGCVEAEKKLNLLKNSLGNKKCDEVVEAVDDLLNENIDSDDEPLITKKSAAKIVKIEEKRDILQEKNDLQALLEPIGIESERRERKLSEISTDVDDEYTHELEDSDLGLESNYSKLDGFDSGEVRGDIPNLQSQPEKSNVTKEKRFFKCDVCKKVFNRRFNFERHLLVHSSQSLTCHACGKQYRRQYVLDKHIKVVHQQVRLANLCCSYCNKGFSSSQSLEDHFRTHTGERPFICEICGKDFRARPNLIAHKKIHTGEMPFACNLCEYRCRLKSTFVDHCQRHEGTRTCLCSICGKGFVNNYDLMKHKKTHSKERRFACTFCSLTFVMKRYLKVHMRTHAQKLETLIPKLEDLLVDGKKGSIEEDENESGDKSKEENLNVGQVRSEDWNIIPKSWLSIISCKYCGKISCAPKQLRQHERRGTCTRTHQCPDCGQEFSKESTVAKHLKSHSKEKACGDKIRKFTCSFCNRKFRFEDHELAHEKICGKGDSTHKCSVCGKRFETKTLADQHWTCHHKSRVCHMCGQSFSKPESLKQHVKTIHEQSKMVCHYCGKEFSRKARLQEHLQHHTGQMEFTCHVCGKGSTNAYSFSIHLATHSQETPYSCSFCPRTFKHMKYVYLHERSVHLKLKSGKTYVKPKKLGKNVAQRTCPLCNKTFRRESAMLIHKRSVHEGKNGYICNLCGKDFKYSYLLYVHKKKHHFPELCKYRCEFCQKPFPVKTELENHLRKHTGEKPYVCGLCGKTYSFHGSLNMHMKTQHENQKNHKCDICGASYNFQSHLMRHMSAHADKFPVEMLSTMKENP